MLVAIPRLAATVQALILVALVGPGEPLVFFTAPKGPRALATVDAIRKPFTRGGLAADGPVYHYVWYPRMLACRPPVAVHTSRLPGSQAGP